MIDLSLVDAVDAEAIGAPGERTFRVRARAGSNRAALWMEKEQLAALGQAISRLLADWDNALESFWKVIPRAALTARDESAEMAEAAPEPTRGVAD